MEFVPTLLGLAGMHILMAMLPGPNTVVVTWYAATRSRMEGFQAVAGVVVASLVWVVLALWGVGTLLLEAGWLYRLLRLAGAAYLIFIGFKLLRSGLASGTGVTGGQVTSTPRPDHVGRNPFKTGLMTTLSNPKSAVFWTSAFLIAVPGHSPTWFYLAIVVITGLQSMLWYGAIALLFSTGTARKLYQRMTHYLDLIAGGVMILLGLKLADQVRREIT